MGNPILLKFEFFQDGRPIRSERLTLAEHLKIGKLSSSHLRIDDPAVSRMHAVIERREPDGVELVDLGSTRGTLVNGDRIDRRLLRSGDRLLLGGTELVVYIGEQDVLRSDQAVPAAPAFAAPGGIGAGPAAGLAAPPPPARPGATLPPPQLPPPPADNPQIDDPTGRRALEISFLWGETVLQVDHVKEQRDVTIGGALACDYFVDPQQLGVESFPLIKVVGTALGLTFNGAMTGLVQTGDGETITLEELRKSGRALPCGDGPDSYRFLLPDECRCKVSLGDLSWLIHLVVAPRRYAPPILVGINRGLVGAFLVAALFWGILQTLFYLAVPEEEGFLLDSFDAANRFAQLMVIPEKQKEPEVPDWFKKKAEEDAKKRQADRAKAKEGKMGQQESDQQNKRVAIKGPQENEDLELRRQRIRDKVVQTGALAALNNDNELAMIWSQSDRTMGADAVNALGNWTGDSVGNARGFGGLSLSGTGRGGGGTGEGSLGVGGLGTRGRAGGNTNYGRGVGDLGDRSGRVPQVTAGKAIVTGSLDREIIRRIIAKHRDEIKYCYEKELATQKDLSGKVVIFFTISPTGAVIAAKVRESTLKAPAVEQCITSRVEKWIFPQPAGGGIVEVSYPFIFKAI